MKNTVKLLSLLMVVCMLLSACSRGVSGATDVVVGAGEEGQVSNTIVPGNGTAGDASTENLSTADKNVSVPEKGSYKEGVALVKYDGEMNDNVLSQLNLVSATALYSGSKWYTVELAAGADTVETVSYLRELGCFDKVDYDYIMKADAEVESVDISSNTYADKLTYLETMGVKKGWESNIKNGKTPGGSPDVIIAIIDTGVDYNHLDLRNNIWVNPAEIPNNGIDDDGNGYVDDIYGWDFVNNDNNPMDDHGHGTHVAGIVAADNNDIGCVGIAYNCKIMCLKAGSSTGYFNSSDIAEAVQYAYMNGASVINMSFGGSNISKAEKEVLENAYNTSILVASAGNAGKCNNLSCPEHAPRYMTAVSYPAALPYVIGVMSCNSSGTQISKFSNFDHFPYDSIEYEVFACGESVLSTYPNNKFASLNGTSMAAPTVSAIAALLRSAYPDRNTYSTKYLQSQIVNTGTNYLDESHTVVNAYETLTKLPTPNVNLYKYFIDDSTSISTLNNANGVIDAGETIRLYISLQNRGGVASNVKASIQLPQIDSLDGTYDDPNFTIINTSVSMSDIGTYSVREAYEDQYFEIAVSSDCPNNYEAEFSIEFTYANGIDETDTSEYTGNGEAVLYVNNGYHLSGSVFQDTVFKADKLYIIGSNLTVPEGITVTFEEGCRIQFYDDSTQVSPVVSVYGTLIMKGTKDNMIYIYPSEQFEDGVCMFEQKESGTISMDYVDAKNLDLNIGKNYYTNNITISNSIFNRTDGAYKYSYGSITSVVGIKVHSIIGCYFSPSSTDIAIEANIMDGNLFHLDASWSMPFKCMQSFTNNVVYNGFSYSSNPFKTLELHNIVSNNKFICDDKNTATLAKLNFCNITTIENNYFSELYRTCAEQAIVGYIDSTGMPTVYVFGSCDDDSKQYPHVVSVEFFDSQGEPVTWVGKEKITVRVTYNRSMDTTQKTYVSFGTVEPYDDYRIIGGEYVSDNVWEATYSLTSQIENGTNYLKLKNARQANDATKSVFEDWILCDFNIDTTEAMSMNLQAVAKENGIELTFAQDDYDTLLGYNIYRSEEKDGNFVRLNPAILLPDELTFLDENAEPGKTYWYTYTVVLTDFSESNPAGKVVAMAMDTLAPNMYHTPVNQGYMNNNLVVSCTATDNVAISIVTLYYRAVGAAGWKMLTMSKQNDKYSATIFGSDLTLDGIEYYIVASDGRNTINKGSAETPYTVIVKDASAISRKGDVDGDGVVDTKDALMIMQCINGDLIMSDDEFKRADLNGDGILSSMEALRILQYINGNVNSLEM